MNPPAQNDAFTGVLERIKYSNEEDGFLIGDLKPEGSKEATTIVGKLPGVHCGETLRLYGSWTHHAVHGPQFKVERFTSELPASIYGIRKYLGSGLVKGVSKGIAERIVARFGEDTLRVISEESARLQEVDGIGKQRARSIKSAWDAQASMRALSLFLVPFGVTSHQLVKINKEYGFAAETLIQDNPYRLARDINGIGFKTCDRIAINMGLANDSQQRIDSGVTFCMQELQDEGHTAFPAKDLVEKASEMLESDPAAIRESILRLMGNKDLRRIDLEDNTVYAQLPYNTIAEEKIAKSVHRLKNTPSRLPPIKREAAADWAQEKAGFTFADSQKGAIIGALESKIFVITGGPGTGKTTILRAIVSILNAKKARVLLAAPTGRAAQRLAEAARAFGQTIHRLLKYDPANSAFTHNESKPLNADVVILDEASMLDTRIASALFQAMSSSAHLILVGDIDQLPSVGAGNVLGDLIDSKEIPYVRLDEVFRQEKRSSIPYYAYSINKGQVSLPTPVENVSELSPDKDMQFLLANDQDDCAEKIANVFKNFVQNKLNLDPIAEAQALAPMHRGNAGVGALNHMLQSILNECSESMPFGPISYRQGDKVIQTRNNYDKSVFNGDIGIIEKIDLEAGSILVNFDGELIDYDKADMIDLSLAYAVSIHKSQGSEYPVVVIPLLKAHFMMLQKNLIYTAITRGKKKVILVGDPAAFAMAVRNNDSTKRCTLLKERLIEEIM